MKIYFATPTGAKGTNKMKKEQKPSYKIYDENDKKIDRFDIFVWVSIIAAMLLSAYAFFGGILG